MPPLNRRERVIPPYGRSAAKLLIDQHGETATIEAMKRADALAAQGDTEGKVVWLRILEAIEELQNTVPSGAVH